MCNSMDSTIVILLANAAMTNFTVQKRLSNTHKLLPLRLCHIEVKDGPGFIVSGSEDGVIQAYDLQADEAVQLPGHGVPVVDISVTPNAKLLASGDVRGRV